jgi:histidinol-phosphatase (PHP family)
MQPPDYHMHTPLCRHAVGEPSEYAAHALSAGLREIGFSDHNPMPQDDFDDWRMRLDQLDEYVAKVEKARRDHPQLTIRLALEVDFFPGGEDWVRDLAARHPWDYLIGSVHYACGWDIDNPKRLDEWRRREPFDVWSAYCENLALAAESRLFDIIGHADLCKKFAIYPQQDVMPLFEPFLRAAAKNGVAMELNTAGLRKDCREIYPAPPIVRRAAEVGVPITFGSDSHALEEVGMNFAEAIALAKECGHTQFATFADRQRTMRPL